MHRRGRGRDLPGPDSDDRHHVPAPAVLHAQRRHEPAGAEELTPPLARHAQQDEAKANADRITVNVHHDADDPKDPKCPPFVAGDVCRNDAHWHISMSGRRYDFTKDGMAKLAQALTELGKAKLEDPAKGISARNLIIRADRTAPYGYVQKVLDRRRRPHLQDRGRGRPAEGNSPRKAGDPARSGRIQVAAPTPSSADLERASRNEAGLEMARTSWRRRTSDRRFSSDSRGSSGRRDDRRGCAG